VKAHTKHEASAPAVSVGCALITTTDSRDESEDVSGSVARGILEGAGHRIVFYGLVPNDREKIRSLVGSLLSRDDVRLIVTTGGTGLGTKDVTVDAIADLLDKRIEGFGILFQMLSYEQIGSAGMLSRALGGVASGKLLFCLPGSPAAVELALQRLIVPQIPHMIWELDRR